MECYNPRQLFWDTCLLLPLCNVSKDYDKMWHFLLEKADFFATLNGEMGSRLQGVKCRKNLWLRLQSIAGFPSALFPDDSLRFPGVLLYGNESPCSKVSCLKKQSDGRDDQVRCLICPGRTTSLLHFQALKEKSTYVLAHCLRSVYTVCLGRLSR